MTDCSKFKDYKPTYLENIVSTEDDQEEGIEINKIGITEIKNEIKENKINAYTSKYIYNNDRTKLINTIDGSVEANIVINSEDKEFVNKDNKLLDEEREAKREMYFRQARVLYPEKEEWVLNMAIDAFMEQQDKGIDITTHKFEKDAEKY
jgi:hypothetical protein